MISIIGEVSEKFLKNISETSDYTDYLRLHRLFSLRLNLCECFEEVVAAGFSLRDVSQPKGCGYHIWNKEVLFQRCLRNHKTGFTLVEMLVVLAIIAMFLGISSPFVSGFGKGLRLRTSAREISSVLRIARSNAVTFRKDFSVLFDVQKGEYLILDSEGRVFDKVFRLPRAIKLRRIDGTDPVTFPDDRITFKPTGSIEGSSGSITITDNRNLSREIAVIGPTGKISIR